MSVENIKFPPLIIEGIPPACIKQKKNSPWMKVTFWVTTIEGDSKDILTSHQCVSIIHSKTQKIYSDDSKLELRYKFAGIIVFTIYVLFLKTIYHCLIPLSFTIEIFKTVKKFNQEKVRNTQLTNQDLTRRIFKTMGKSLVDIVKTPLYAIALASIALGVSIASLFHSELLYDGREAYGKVARALTWGDRKTIWIIAPCMQNRYTLAINAKKRIKKFNNILYASEPGTVLFGLTNIVASYREFSTQKNLINS